MAITPLITWGMLRCPMLLSKENIINVVVSFVSLDVGKAMTTHLHLWNSY